MRPLTKAVFGAAATAALALTPTSATLAETPATENVTPPNTSVLEVQVLDARNYTEENTGLAAATASQNRVTIVIWGGNLTLQKQAFAAANDLVSVGIPAALVIGPDKNSLSGDAVLQVYALGVPYSDGRMGTDFAHEVREDMRTKALQAHREKYTAPQFSLRQQ